jgi:hypothetical protein
VNKLAVPVLVESLPGVSTCYHVEDVDVTATAGARLVAVKDNDVTTSWHLVGVARVILYEVKSTSEGGVLPPVFSVGVGYWHVIVATVLGNFIDTLRAVLPIPVNGLTEVFVYKVVVLHVCFSFLVF